MEDNDWVDSGHEIAFEQFGITNYLSKCYAVPGESDLKIIYTESQIIIQNHISKLTIDQKTGEIINWIYQDYILTSSPIRPNFWRPPTDNDLGNGMHEWGKIWKDNSEGMTPILLTDPQIVDYGVTYKTQYMLKDSIAKVTVDYSLTGQGELIVDYSFFPMIDTLPKMPKVGMTMLVPDSFKNVSWYGRGPHETYWDRKSSGKIAIHEGEVINQFHRYSRPQETGNKADIRWMSLESDDIFLTAQPLDGSYLSCSIWPFLSNELEFEAGKKGSVSASGLVPITSKHGAHIKTGNIFTWNIDHLQMGVGGDTSWGRHVHDEYSIPPKEYTYSFVIIPALPW